MPFKSGKSPTDASNRVNETLDNAMTVKAEKALYSVTTQVQANSEFYVPEHFKALVNSAYVDVRETTTGMRGVVGYGGEPNVSYAQYLHGNESYTPDWKPRPLGASGKKTGSANMNATPQWIPRGVDDTDVMGIFAQGMEL